MEVGTIVWAVLGVLLAALLIYAIQIYNSLVALKQDTLDVTCNV